MNIDSSFFVTFELFWLSSIMILTNMNPEIGISGSGGEKN
jgi:hypothetical protein